MRPERRRCDRSCCYGRDGGSGYGRFTIRGKAVPAHRFSYELENGPIPPGLVVDHLCNDRACVNPAHLEAKPGSENLDRARPVLTDEQQQLLEEVSTGYEDKRRAEENTRAAVMRARASGLSYPAIAKAAGVSHPAIIDLVKRIEAKGSTSY